MTRHCLDCGGLCAWFTDRCKPCGERHAVSEGRRVGRKLAATFRREVGLPPDQPAPFPHPHGPHLAELA